MSEQDQGSSPATPSRRDLLKVGATVLAAGALSECAPILGPGKRFPPNGTPERYDAIIVGTGFGATVAATELANACPKARILLLERGVFFTSPERPVPDYISDNKHPYQYWPTPDNDTGFRRAFLDLVRTNTSTSFRSRAGRSPLYMYNIFDDVDVLTANGVGGGSLVYSNVSLRPFFDGTSYPVMADWPLKLDTAAYDAATKWMTSYRGTLSNVVTTAPLTPALEGSVKDLEMAPGGDHSYLYLPRSKALRDASRGLPAASGSWSVTQPWEPLDLQVFEDRKTAPAALKNQRFCERQGRCFLGCLPGARHTLNKTLIAKLLNDPAHKDFVSLKPLMHVGAVRPVENNEYEVVHHHVVTGDEHRSRAPLLILAAGVIGSTEILLHARDEQGLVLSDALGSRFSTNGDLSGFVRNIPTELGSHPKRDNRVLPTRGPINTSHVHFEANWNGHKLHINVEDAGIPPMFAKVARVVIDSMKEGRLSFGRLLGRVGSTEYRDKTEHQMVEDIFWFNCMGVDGKPGTPFADAAGRFRLERGRLRLEYKQGTGPTDHPVFGITEEIMKALAMQMKGEYVPFPLSAGLFGKKKVVVTHPLGGCPMGTTSSDGVVDTQGQAFNTRQGSASTYPGLYVMDGSVMPGPVAVNPTLTIVAMSLKMAASAKAFLKTARPRVCV